MCNLHKIPRVERFIDLQNIRILDNMSFYDNTQEQDISINGDTSQRGSNAYSENNDKDDKNNPHKSSSFAKIIIFIFALMIISSVIVYAYFLIILPSPILKALEMIPLNKPVPLSTLIFVIENLSSIKTNTQYNNTYNIQTGFLSSTNYSTVKLQLNATDYVFMSDNITKTDINIKPPSIFSSYMQNLNVTFLNNGNNNYLCVKINTGTSTCINVNSSSKQNLNFSSYLKDNITKFFNGTYFTMKTLSVLIYKNYPCILINGTITGIPNELSMYAQTQQNNTKDKLNGKISTCINLNTHLPYYLNLNIDLNTFNSRTLFQNSSVYFYMNQTGSGTPLNRSQILLLPGNIITNINLTDMLSSSLLSNYIENINSNQNNSTSINHVSTTTSLTTTTSTSSTTTTSFNHTISTKTTAVTTTLSGNGGSGSIPSPPPVP